MESNPKTDHSLHFRREVCILRSGNPQTNVLFSQPLVQANTSRHSRWSDSPRCTPRSTLTGDAGDPLTLVAGSIRELKVLVAEVRVQTNSVLACGF
jgi:hypothetical protein